MPGWKLIPLTPTDQQVVHLRRYCSSEVSVCSGPHGYHTASVRVGVLPIEWKNTGSRRHIGEISAATYPRTDGRWPQMCAHPGCMYAFADVDHWQVNGDQLYTMPDGSTTTLDASPVASCWQAWWLLNDDGKWPYKNGDQVGAPLYIKCPPGRTWDIWAVDGDSENGSGWPRTGGYADMTANPSILFHGDKGGKARFHSFLKNGILLADIEGNQFPGCPYTA